MLYFENIYKEAENGGQKYTYSDFKCEYCEQPFNHFSLNLSVFQYGAAFLVGKEFGYVGITCPSCLKTMLLRGNDLTRLQQDLSFFIGPNGSHLDPDPRYHSSVIYSPHQFPYLKDFDIMYLNSPLTGSKQDFHNLLCHHLAENSWLEQDYLCSYIFNSEAPIGAFASVWWFKPDHVDDLVKIENEHQVRVFPRYVHKMSFYERYDWFCWEYKLYQDYLRDRKKTAEANIDALRKYTKEQNINLDNLLEANPGVLSSVGIEILEEQAQQRTSNDVKAASEFLDLLINYDPYPWDIPGTMSDFYKGLWKSVTPFKDSTVPASVEELDRKKFKPKMPDAQVREMTDEIREHKNKTHIQEWLQDNYLSFIKDYISLAGRTDFSYGYVYDLKCRYLKQLRGILDRVTMEEAKYAFYAEGPTWTITFNGNTTRGLKQRGFKYIEYLIRNQHQEFHTDYLSQLDGIDPVDDEYENVDFSRSVSKAKDGKIIDKHTKDEYDKQLKQLQENLLDAEQSTDPLIRQEAEKALEDFLKEYENAVGKGGKIREFNSKSKKVKSRITKAIERAVKELKIYDEKAYQHFSNVLSPINSFKQCYRPVEDIEWEIQ